MAWGRLRALEEAAAIVAQKGGGTVEAVETAMTALSQMGAAVTVIAGKVPEVLKRTSVSTGTERLSFILAELNHSPSPSIKELLAKASEVKTVDKVVGYFQSRGLNAVH